MEEGKQSKIKVEAEEIEWTKNKNWQIELY